MTRRIVLGLIAFLVFIGSPISDRYGITVFASNIQCNDSQFRLANITINKTYETIACYGTFEQANQAMDGLRTTYNDMVIIHEASRSPLKIIAASRAIAASYPFRTLSSGVNNILAYIYRNSNLSGENTYMARHLDMGYERTVSYNETTGSGSAYINISGFKGYIQLLQIDIVPLIYLENGWEITLGGSTYEEHVLGKTDQEQPFTLIPRMNEYRVYTNTTTGVREIFHETFSFWSGNSYGTYLYGMAPAWLPNGTYYSWDSIHFFHDRAMTQPVMDQDEIGAYFNYYMYLPMRTSSNITAKQLDDYLISRGYTSKPTFDSNGVYTGGSAMYGEGEAFINGQNTYGVNALLIYAMAIHESGHGTSRLARDKNNLFGWGAHDANPSDAYLFESISQSVSEHMGRNLRGYLSVENWRYFGQVLGNKNNGFNTKYASDPYWGNKIAGHAYRIDRYHGFLDYDTYKIGIIDKPTSIVVRKQPSSSATSLMTVRSSVQQHAFLINEQTKNGNEAVISTMAMMPVDAQGNAIAFNTTASLVVPYNWHQSIGYLVNEPIKIIYKGSGFDLTPNVIDQRSINYSSNAQATTLSIQQGKLMIEGHHVQKGLSVVDANNITHRLDWIAIDQTVTSSPLNTISSTDFNSIFNETRYISDHMGFANEVDLSDFLIGTYRLIVTSEVTLNGQKTMYQNSLKRLDVNLKWTTNDKEYTLVSDSKGDLLLHVDTGVSRQTIEDPIMMLDTIGQQQTIARKNTEPVSYVSSKPDIATVNDQGVVTAISSGITTIQIKQNDTTLATVAVMVSVPVQSMTLDSDAVILRSPSQVKAIVATLVPATATNKDVFFVSDNNFIASVTQDGVIMPVNNGKTKIHVISKYDNSIFKTIDVTVAYDLISITPPSSTLLIDRFVPVRMTLNYDPVGPYIQGISYQSSDPRVATVNSLGDIIPLANGKTIITATSTNGKTATLEVEVSMAQIDVPVVLLGDVNGDGVVDILDLARISRYLAELDTLSENARLAADINRDGIVDILDLARLSRILAELE